MSEEITPGTGELEFTGHGPTIIDQGRIKSIIERKLTHAPQEAKSAFPAVLKEKHILWATISERQYFMVVFLTPEEERRINEFVERRLNPFPGLITTGPEGAAFKVKESRYMSIRNCEVSNSFTLSLGPDSTILLEDHYQSINTKDVGLLSYKIPLAYVLSYGNEINAATLYEYFDGLVAYSTNMWREAHG
jgi:hypothetical protein